MRKVVCTLALLACAGASHGQTKVGDWNFGIGDTGYPFMFTENEAGVLFGQWCDTESDTCFFQVISTTRCGPDFEAAVLMNVEGGAEAGTLACKGAISFRGKTMYRYRLTPYAQVKKIIQRGPRLGMVIPVEGDNFRVLRFPLDGAADVLSRADAARQSRGSARNTGDTGDTVRTGKRARE